MMDLRNKKLRRAAAVMLTLSVLALPVLSFAANWQWMAPQRVTALLKEGSGLWLIDVRNESAFNESHVEGAMLIPADFLATKRLPKGKIMVLVDDSLGLRKGRGAAEILQKNGHDKVFLLEGGLYAWVSEGYPLAGTGSGRTFRSVMPDDIRWAQEHQIPLKVLDVRDPGEQVQGPVQQAQAVEGKSLAERLEKVKEMLTRDGKKGLAAKLEKPVTTIIVFPTATDARPVLEHYFRGVPGDVRYLAGGYAARAAKPDRNLISARGTCPTCPAGVSGGNK